MDKLTSNPEEDQKDGAYLDELVGTSTELHSELLLPKPLEVEPTEEADDSDTDMVYEGQFPEFGLRYMGIHFPLYVEIYIFFFR